MLTVKLDAIESDAQAFDGGQCFTLRQRLTIEPNGIFATLALHDAVDGDLLKYARCRACVRGKPQAGAVNDHTFGI